MKSDINFLLGSIMTFKAQVRCKVIEPIPLYFFLFLSSQTKVMLSHDLRHSPVTNQIAFDQRDSNFYLKSLFENMQLTNHFHINFTFLNLYLKDTLLRPT